jgi:hypothetical protein
MKLQLFTAIVSVSVFGLLGNLVYSNSASAQTASFICDTSKVVPVTVARTQQGDIPVIKWVRDDFSGSGYPPEKRCAEVSSRFQDYHSKGQLNFLTTGRMNGQNVVCVAARQGGPCTGLLFTLRPNANPGKILQALMAVRVRSSGPLNETTERIYIDMNQYLEAASTGKDYVNSPVESNSNTPNPQEDEINDLF